MTIRRTMTALAATAALLTLLAGCSVNVTDSEANQPISTSQTDREDSAAGDDTDDIDDIDDTDGADDSADTDDAADTSDSADDESDFSRDQISAIASTVMKCDNKLILEEDGLVVRVEGDCDLLIVKGTGSQIVTDDVTRVKVLRDGNVVLTEDVDHVLVNGDGNVVHWQGGTPDVNDNGVGNVVKAG